MISLILSDVIGNSLDLIASGPTVPDFSTPQQCLDCFQGLGILDEVPQQVLDLLQEEAVRRQLTTSAGAGQQGLTAMHTSPVKAPVPNHNCQNANNVIVGSNAIAVEAARVKAEQLGYITHVLSLELAGEARLAGTMLSSLAEYICHYIGNAGGTAKSGKALVDLELELVGQGVSKASVNQLVQVAHRCCNSGRPICLLASGETVVNVKGTGKGGRNQELALAAAVHMRTHMFPSVSHVYDVVLLSCGTDGQDGPTDAAGAYATLTSLHDCPAFLAEEYLDNNDAYNFYKDIQQSKDLIITGMTGTNVMDVQILLIQPKSPKPQP